MDLIKDLNLMRHGLENVGYVFLEICQLSPFGSHKLVVAYVLQGVISVSASTAARYSKPSVIVG